MRIAIIPARGGSKRIPKKNIKQFCGKPMIAYSIDAAYKSNLFDRVIVSTDDESIEKLAQRYGVEVIKRPKELADDFTPTIPVIAHAIQHINENLNNIVAVCCIYATAPFIQASYIKEAYEKLLSENADYAFPTTTFPFPIQRAVTIKDNKVEMFYPEHFNTRSQDLQEAYHDVGQFYWGTPEAWVKGTPIFSKNATSIVLPRYLVQDIDTIEDWQRAEIMHKVLHNENLI